MKEPPQLLESSARGDPGALEMLLEHHLPALHAFVRLRMGPELRATESTSDLVQSSCREVLQNLGQFRHRGESNFRHWLFTTTLRKIKNRVAYHRASRRDVRRRQELSSLAQVYQTVLTPSDELVREEQLARLEAAFDTLPEPYQEVITLVRLMGLSHQETARRMQRTESATRMLLFRALARLAVAMREDRT